MCSPKEDLIVQFTESRYLPIKSRLFPVGCSITKACISNYPESGFKYAFLLGRFSVTDPVPTRLSLGQKKHKGAFVFLLNRIQSNSPSFFACGFAKLFSVPGGNRVCLCSSHLPDHSESSGSKALGAHTRLAKSSVKALKRSFKEPIFPLVMSLLLTWCYFLVSISYTEGSLPLKEGHIEEMSVNT